MELVTVSHSLKQAYDGTADKQCEGKAALSATALLCIGILYYERGETSRASRLAMAGPEAGMPQWLNGRAEVPALCHMHTAASL
jgi:hypothetical protein